MSVIKGFVFQWDEGTITDDERDELLMSAATALGIELEWVEDDPELDEMVQS